MFENFNSMYSEIMEQKPKHGIDPLELMLKLISLIHTNIGTVEKELTRFKSYLVEKLKRGITRQEEINLLKGLHNYLASEPETNERREAMKYLFTASFLND